MLSVDGPDHNVLKIKPPMCFSIADADEVVKKLDMILLEIDNATEETATAVVRDKASHDSATSLVNQSAVPVTNHILSLA